MADVTLRAALAEVFPSADDTDNDNMCDVIGNKTDTTAGNSIYGLLKFAANELILVNSRLHNVNKVYPTLADGKVVTAEIAAWTLGNPVEIIPAGTVTSSFDIHFVAIEGASATDVYELVLYSGADIALTEIGRIRTSKQVANTNASSVPIPCSVQPANTRIAAKLACKGGAGRTLTISLAYTIYTT